MNVLVLSDHDEAAKRIARLLSGGTATGSSRADPPVYTFDRDGTTYRVAGLDGHLLETDFPSGLRDWRGAHLRDLVHADLEATLDPGKAPRVDALRSLAAASDQLIVATANDAESELAAVEAVALLREGNQDLPVRRVRVTAHTTRAIDQAFDDLGDLDVRRAAAARLRRRIDLTWTAVLTRFVALTGKAPRGGYLRLGRTECAVLASMAHREREIRSFVPEPYWEVSASLGGPTPFQAHHVRGRFDAEHAARRAHAEAQAAGDATVVSVDATTVSERPPRPLDADALQRDAAQYLGMTAAKAMETADRLFLEGYITDPRTGAAAVPSTAVVDDVLDTLAKTPEYRPLVHPLREFLGDDATREPTRSAGSPPVHPVQAARKTDLAKAEWDVYDLVVRRFLAMLAPEARGERRSVHLRVGGEEFQATGFHPTEPGWRRVFPFGAPRRTELPHLEPGTTVPVTSVEVLEDVTQPPPRYDQPGLLGLMQDLGLGTWSTRPKILESLSDRNLVKSPPIFEPTETALAVINALERHAKIITDPARVAALDEKIEQVAQGMTTGEDVVGDSRRMLEEALTILEEKEDVLAGELGAAFRRHARVGPCPTCGKDLVIRTARKTGKRFIGCAGWPDCNQTYPLPQAGRVESLETVCDACGAPEMRAHRHGRDPWEFCANIDCPNREDREPPRPASATPVTPARPRGEAAEPPGGD